MKINIYLSDIDEPLHLYNDLATKFLDEFTNARKEWISIQGDSEIPKFAYIRRDSIVMVVSQG